MPQPWDSSNIQHSKSNAPKIAIAIPYNGKWEPEWVMKTFVPLNYFPVNWCIKAPIFCKVPSLPLARDTLVNDAIKADCDYIFFIDTDNVFESPIDPNIALNMLYQCMINNKDAKIVSGLYRAKQPIGFTYAMWMNASKNDNKHFVPIQSWTGNWIQADVIGMGCCLIDIQVFKNTPRPWFHWEISGEMSEDFYFCQKAAKAGYMTRVFTDVKLSHLGNLKVKVDGTIVTPDM